MAPGYDPHEVALEIVKSVTGVSSIESPDLFQSYRLQMNSIVKGILVVLIITLILSVSLMSLLYSMAVKTKWRREVGVLRAIGATRVIIFRALLSEAGILALTGGLSGIILTIVVTFLFRKLYIKMAGLPLAFPSLPSLLLQIGIGFAVTFVAIALAATIPSYRISHQDPATSMRE